MIRLLFSLALSACATQTVSVPSKSPLAKLKVMLRAGSADDARGKEGTAVLTAELLVEGSFGDPKAPLTKDKLAELTRPWGSAAYPMVSVGKETTVFSFSVPREAAAEYIEKVVRPMFNRPLFDAKELDRLRAENLQSLTSGLRLERIEDLGLTVLDNVVHEGTSYAHPDVGTESGLKAVTRADVREFYRKAFVSSRLTLGVASDDAAVSRAFESAFPAKGGPVTATALAAPKAPSGRSALIVALPSALSTGIHAAFPLKLTRADADYWPLYIGNIWLGTHRDSFSHLFQALREQRGYNYGDYSYIEHFEDRPENLFPPPNFPRSLQYFSLWVRPVAHPFAPHVVKAVTWELENFIRAGLSAEDCELARKKARVLYLSLSETTDRLLAGRLDDSFYGLKTGYLEGYLKNVEGVRCEDVNSAIRRRLKSKDLEFVLVTDKSEAPRIAEALASSSPAYGKALTDYQIDVKDEGGKKTYEIPEAKLDLLRLDAVWAHEPLGLTKDRIRVVPVEKMFVTPALP